MKIVATTQELARSKSIRIEKQNAGKCIVFFVGKFEKHTDYSSAARRLGVDESDIVELVENIYRKGTVPSEISYDEQAKPEAYRTRLEQGSANRVGLYETFEKAFKVATCNHVIEWEREDNTCCLDIDFATLPPTASQLLSFASTIHPAPLYYWLSRSGGLHAIYLRQGNLLASELAACAGFAIQRRYPHCKVELLHRTRMVPEGNELYECVPDDDIGILKSMLLESDTQTTDEWLSERGWKVGDRYPHTECPVCPSERAKKNTNPVVVRNDHIQCYICEADGRYLGSRVPGRFPIAALAGGRTNTQIAACVNNFVHYGHAKHVLQLATISRPVYSALLKLKYNDDPRIPHAFTAGEPNGLVRYAGFWCDYDGKPVACDKSSAILKTLPHVMKPLVNGAVSVDTAACEWLSQTVDHSVRGYIPITPIRGFMLTQFQTLPANKIYTVLQIASLQPQDMQSRRPEYVPKSHRMPIEDAWRAMEQLLPGIDCKLIEIALVGRGCVEHRSGLPPMLFLTGPTGSGKTAHIQIAAAIAGDMVSTVKLSKDQDRFFNSLLQAKQQGGFVFFDEFFKFARKAGQTEVEAMENLLAFTTNQMVYLNYIGAVPLGELPLFLWADSQIPEEVKGHEQIGRRVFHHHLNRELHWEQSLGDSGIGDLTMLRARGSMELVTAMNAILSHVVEEYFSGPVTDFATVAEALGFKRIRDSEAVNDKYTLIRELFVATCNAPDLTDGHDKKRWPKRGYKLAYSNAVSPLYDALLLCQSEAEQGTLSCRVIEETDLMQALGFKQPAKLDIRKHGAKFAIRFVSQDETLVNGELAQ